MFSPEESIFKFSEEELEALKNEGALTEADLQRFESAARPRASSISDFGGDLLEGDDKLHHWRYAALGIWCRVSFLATFCLYVIL